MKRKIGDFMTTEELLKQEDLSINELINLVYQSELSNDLELTLKIYKKLREKYLQSFKSNNHHQEKILMEQNIMKKLYDIINNKIENLNEIKRTDKNGKYHIYKKNK